MLFYFISFCTPILQKILINIHMNISTVEKFVTFDHTVFLQQKRHKIAELPAETCTWKYHNKNTSAKLGALYWCLIHSAMKIGWVKCWLDTWQTRPCGLETKILSSKLWPLDNQSSVFKNTESSWKATSSTRASVTAGEKSGHESGPVWG